MHYVTIAHTDIEEDCWCREGSEIKIWLADNCDYYSFSLNEGPSRGKILFELEDDKVKFILRWV